MENRKIFTDTSAFYALMDRSDKHHKESAARWTSLLERNQSLLTTNYIVLETNALLQNRLGFDAASIWHRDILDIFEVQWINYTLHELAFELWFNMGQRGLSLVDCASFVTMRQHHCDQAFCFDRHFVQQGFDVLTINEF